MKRGVSLIAVLMFMLAATTASVVIFRMIGSEGFSSGARLKASEAYQASESGIDAVRNWLANRGTEAGDLVTQYMDKNLNPGKKPVKINLVDTNAFKAYVIGVDASGGNSKPVRLKILVEGKGRDNSIVTQTAILNVSGLYKTSIPSNSNNIQEPEPEQPLSPDTPPIKNPLITPCEPDQPPPPSSSSGRPQKLPDLWGNMTTAGFIKARTMIITQTPGSCNGGGQALNSIEIGKSNEPGYLILDGNFYTNNGIYIYGDVYARGDFDLCASGADFITGNLYVGGEFHPRVSTGTLSIGGSAYFASSVNPNVPSPGVCIPPSTTPVKTRSCYGQLGGTVRIGGNSTMMGPYLVFDGCDGEGKCGGGGNMDFDIKGSLVMGGSSYIDLGKTNNSTSKFEVQKNVWVKRFNPASPNLSYSSNSVLWPTFGKNNISQLCLELPVTQQGTTNLYKDNASAFYFRTNTGASYVTSPCSQSHDDWGADPMDDLKEEVEVPSGSSSNSNGCPGTNSCDRPPIKFDTNTIYQEARKANPASWMHNDSKPGKCPTTSGKMTISTPWSNLLDQLNACWKNKTSGSSELYNGKWFAIYVKNQHKYGEVNGNLGNGKYIIVFDFDEHFDFDINNKYLFLPPTGPNATVMLYFPKGFPGTIQLGGNETGKIPQLSEYNYFIFSDGDIGEFNTTKERVLHGNVFMNKCAAINSANPRNPYFYSKGNDNFVDQLMDAQILSKIEYACGGAGGSNPSPTYTLACDAPPATGTEGTEITTPTVTCTGTNGSVKSNCGFSWTGAPIWASPVAGTYTVGVSGNSGDCKGQTVDCGTLTVTAPPSSSSVAPSSSSNSTSASSSSNTPGGDYDDEYEPWIPISARLAVKVESKEISKEKIPADPIELKKSILVMPRAVRIQPGENISGDKLRKFYSYMPLNGAKRSDTTQNLPTCEDLNLSSPTGGVYTCSFPGVAPRHSSFYVVVGENDNLPAEEGVECKFSKGNYTQGENIKPIISCKNSSALLELDKANFNTYGEFTFPTNYTNWNSDGYAYFPGIEAEQMEGIVTVSGVCGGAQETPCEPYLTIKKPTCNISRGPYYSVCGSGAGDCVSIPLVAPPTHSCGDAPKYPNPPGIRSPFFNVSYANDDSISRNAPAWNGTSSNFAPQNHTFNSVGDNRVIRMYEVSCDGNRLNYGTSNGGGIVCGTIDVKKIGGESGFGNSICEDLNLCGGNVPWASILDNSTEKPTLKQCVFVNDYTALTTATTGNGGTILINGTICKGNNTNCMSTKPAPIDGGYYIYVHLGAINNYSVSSKEKPDCSGTTHTLSCSSVPETGTVGVPITSPTVTCNSSQVYTGSLVWEGHYPDWSNPTSGTYSNISVKATDGNCIGQSTTCSGSLVVSAFPTITCTLAKNDVTQGENIGPPTITCSTGILDKSNIYFQGPTPMNDLDNWKSTGNAYYGTSQSFNSGSIQVLNVKCGSFTISGNTNCGNITVRKPTCNDVNGTLTVNQAITPIVSCGKAAKSGTTPPTFDGGSGWNPNDNGGGSYNSTGSKTISLSSVTCDGHLISGITDVSCGRVEVQSSGGTIDLTNATNDNWNQNFSAGTYTVTTGSKNKCSLNCADGIKDCSVTGAINGSTTSWSIGPVDVANGQVTISGGVKFVGCW